MIFNLVGTIASVISVLILITQIINKKISKYKLSVHVIFGMCLNPNGFYTSEAISIRNIGNRTIYLENIDCWPVNREGETCPPTDNITSQMHVELKPQEIHVIHSCKPNEWLTKDDILDFAKEKRELYITIEDSEEKNYYSKNIYSKLMEVKKVKDYWMSQMHLQNPEKR